MKKHAVKFVDSHRYQLVHAEGGDVIAYQRHRANGRWQTVSIWMIPQGGWH